MKLGGWTAGSERSQRDAAQMAERMRPVMAELADLSAHKAAAELNRRKIPTATGGQWYAATVIRLRERIARIQTAISLTSVLATLSGLAIACLLSGESMYVDCDADMPTHREHPWTVSEATIEARYWDFRNSPEQISSVLEDFSPGLTILRLRASMSM